MRSFIDSFIHLLLAFIVGAFAVGGAALMVIFFAQATIWVAQKYGADWAAILVCTMVGGIIAMAWVDGPSGCGNKK